MARLLAAVIILFPLSFVRVDQRGAALSTMSIQVEKNSPAFAAFEDLQNSYYDITEYDSSPRELVQLVSGTEFVPEVPMQNNAIELVPMRISLNTTKVFKPQALNKREVIKDESLPDWGDTESLPSVHKRKEMILAHLSLDSYQEPTVSEKAKALVEKELHQSKVVSGVRTIETSGGGAIIVKKPGSRSPYVASIGSSEEAGDSSYVTGSFKVHGVPELGPQYSRWHLFRLVDGRKAETGRINIQESRFAIRVGDRRGMVVAEVSDLNGNVFGRGQVSLNQDQLTLSVNPVDTAPTIAVAGAEFGGDVPISKVAATYKPYGNSFVEGPVDDSLDVSQYSPESRFFIEAGAGKYFATVAYGVLADLKRIPLYTVQAMKAFRGIVKSFYRQVDLSSLSVVWGKVFKGGKEVLGAKIEIAGSEGKVIYFNEIGIPRKDKDHTSSDGQFAIVNLPEGVQSVRVEHEGKKYPAYIFPSFNGKISSVNLEIPTNYFKQQFGFYSLLDKQLVATSLRMVGEELVHEIAESLIFEVPSLRSGLLFEADAGPEYEMLRVHLPQLIEESEIDLPLFPVSWVESLVHASDRVLDRRLGWAIGFAGDTAIEVSLPNEHSGLSQIVYFDKDFNLSPERLVPPGGGYLIFNMPIGFQTVETRPIYASESYVESFVSEPYFLYLIGSQRFVKPLGQQNLEPLRQ